MGIKFSALEDAQALTGAEIVPLVQNGGNVQSTTGAIAALAGFTQSSPFVTISGTVMDIGTGVKFKKVLSSNVVLTTVNFVNGNVALLEVVQDATGSRTVSINGQAISINTAANSTTLIGFTNTGTVIEYYTNQGGGSAPVDNWIDIIYNSGNLTAVGKVWSGPDSGFGNSGTFGTSFAAGQTVTMIARVNAATDVSTIYFQKTNSAAAYPTMDYGVNIPGELDLLTHLNGGSSHFVSLGQNFVVGEWYGIKRDGSTGVFTFLRSLDKVTWSTVYTLTGDTYTGIIYPYANTFGTSKLDTPQYLLP